MLKRTFILGAGALIAFSAYSYANDEANEKSSTATEQEILVVEGTDQTEGSESIEAQLLAVESDEANESESKEETTLVTDETTSEESSSEEVLANDDSSEASDVSEQKEETVLASCSNGHCPVQMIEKLRQEKQAQEKAAQETESGETEVS